MDVIGSLLTFCDSTCIVNIVLKIWVFSILLLSVICDFFFLTCWSLVTDVYTCYLIENNCMKMVFMT